MRAWLRWRGYPRATRREVFRLASLGQVHPDPGVAGTAWQVARGRRRHRWLYFPVIFVGLAVSQWLPQDVGRDTPAFLATIAPDLLVFVAAFAALIGLILDQKNGGLAQTMAATLLVDARAHPAPDAAVTNLRLRRQIPALVLVVGAFAVVTVFGVSFDHTELIESDGSRSLHAVVRVLALSVMITAFLAFTNVRQQRRDRRRFGQAVVRLSVAGVSMPGLGLNLPWSTLRHTTVLCDGYTRLRWELADPSPSGIAGVLATVDAEEARYVAGLLRTGGLEFPASRLDVPPAQILAASWSHAKNAYELATA